MKRNWILFLPALFQGCDGGSTKFGLSRTQVDYSQFKKLVEQFYKAAGWTPIPQWEEFDTVLDWVKSSPRTSVAVAFIDAIGQVNILLETKLASLRIAKRPSDKFARGLLRMETATRMMFNALTDQGGIFFQSDKRALLRGAKKLLEGLEDDVELDTKMYRKYLENMRACEVGNGSRNDCDSQARMLLQAIWTVTVLKSLLHDGDRMMFTAGDTIKDRILSSRFEQLSTDDQELTRSKYHDYVAAMHSVLDPPSQYGGLKNQLEEAIDKMGWASNFNTNFMSTTKTN